VAAAADASWDGYYINLDRAVERRQRIEGQLARFGLGVRYKRFPAVDGRRLNRPSLRSPGEVGIFRSHLDIIERIAASERPGHVIEDDILFSDLTGPAIATAIKRGVLDTFDVLFLETYVGEAIAGIRIYHWMFEQAMSGGPIEGPEQLRILDLNEGYQSGATSYVVSPQKAAKVAAILRTHWEHGPNLPVDMIFQQAVRAGQLSVGCVFPFVTTIDLETSWMSEAARQHRLDRAMFQRLIRYTFFVRRDLPGYAAPALDRVMAAMPPPVAGDAMAFYSRIVQYLLTSPPEFP
jgi:GR25 family glycosyltransferase involved in LPS biosynthesis